MRAYIIRRLLLMIPTMFLVTVMIFAVIRLIPGDVVELMVAQMAGGGGGMPVEEIAEHVREALGMDVPIHIQYGHWVGAALHGDLGESLWSGRAVTEELTNRLPVTLELSVIAIITALLISLPIGIYSAIRQDTGGDYVGRIIAILGISLPSFWVGTMVIIYPSIWLDWSPPVEYISLVENLTGNLTQFVLPAVIMGMSMTGTTMRMTRTMMLEVLRQDYIRTAWAKGLGERAVIMRHALKNAMIPVVSQIGLLIPLLIAGSVVIEQIFCLPGIGLLLIGAINQRDYPIICGINLMLATFVIVINLVVDLTYALLDPRVQYR